MIVSGGCLTVRCLLWHLSFFSRLAQAYSHDCSEATKKESTRREEVSKPRFGIPYRIMSSGSYQPAKKVHEVDPD